MKEVLISSAVLILIVFFIRDLLKDHISARLRYALWGLVLLRLLIPVSFFDSPLSFASLYERTGIPESMVPVERITVPYAEGVNGYVAPEHDPIRQKVEAGEDVLPFQIWIHDEETDTPTTEYVFLEPWEDVVARYLPPVWIGGCVVVGAWFLIANLRFRLRLRRSRLVFATAEDYPLPVYITGCIASPCMTGVLKPAVYLTPAAVEDPDRLRHVLAHELCHYRHRDHIWALLRGLCLVLHWWNPLVWLAAVFSRIDGELACDEGAVSRLGDTERAAYGHTLLDLAVLKQGPESLLRTATSIGAGKREMKSRIHALTRKRLPLTVGLVIVALLALLLAGCTFLGSEENVEVPDEVLEETPVDDAQHRGEAAEVAAAFDRASEAMGWFTGYGEISMDFNSTGREYKGIYYYPVSHSGLTTMAELEMYLGSMFSPATCEALLETSLGAEAAPVFCEFDGRLHSASGNVGQITMGDCPYQMGIQVIDRDAQLLISWSGQIWDLELTGQYYQQALKNETGNWIFYDDFSPPILEAVREYERRQTEGEHKLILTCLRREGDVLICEEVDGEKREIEVPINGLLTESKLEALIRDNYILVATYDERTNNSIETVSLHIGMRDGDTPDAGDPFFGGKFTVYRVSDGETRVVQNLSAVNHRELRRAIMAPMLSSVLNEAIDLSTVTEYCLIVLDYAGLTDEEKPFAGSYYFYREPGTDEAYTYWIQTLDSPFRHRIGREIYDILVNLVDEQGVPFED